MLRTMLASGLAIIMTSITGATTVHHRTDKTIVRTRYTMQAAGLLTVILGALFSLAAPAHAQKCRAFTFAALMDLVDGRCTAYLETTAEGKRAYEIFVRAGRAEVAACAAPGATTEDAQGSLGVFTADGMIDKLAGTSIRSPNNAQTLTKQCNALAKILDTIGSGAPLYTRK
jgi:hypothetical protein